MSIKVEWVDPNSGTTDYVIYRQDTPIDVGSLPAPLATVPSSARSYIDDTVVRNKLYYYVVGSRKGADVAYTPNKPITFMPYTGPGPQDIKRGDWGFGYFGRVPLSDVFAPQELKLGIGLTVGTEVPAAGLPDAVWLKFVHKGKIVFIPNIALWYGITWEQLYKAGLLFGATPSSDWPDYPKTTWGIVPQNKMLTRYNGDHSFIVRTPSSRVSPNIVGTAVEQITGGEYDKILAYAYASRVYPDTQGYNQVDDLVNTYYTHSCDMYSGSSAIFRSPSAGAVDNPFSVPTNSPGTSSHGWRPLLELIL